MLNIMVFVKRVPATGARIVLTEDNQTINTRHLGFTVSPHEECAVEEAVQQIEKHGGRASVLTLGPEDAVDQLRDALAMGIDEAVHLETDGGEWGPVATARAITAAVKIKEAENGAFDLLIFGNELADSGGYQVGLRIAEALDRPCLPGIKGLEIHDGKVIGRREVSGGWEVYQTELPAVVTVKEGINLPRYPSLRGKLVAKKKAIDRQDPTPSEEGLKKIRLETPEIEYSGAEILGEGPGAAGRIVDLLEELGLVD